MIIIKSAISDPRLFIPWHISHYTALEMLSKLYKKKQLKDWVILYLYKIRLQGFTSVNGCCLYLFFIYLFIGASATPWWEELKREERKWCATVKWEKSVTSLCANHSDWCGGVRFKQITYLYPLIYFLMMNGSRRGMESYT